MNNFLIQLKKIRNFLSSPQIFSVASLWLMVLLVCGTISQKDLGLYVSQQRFFSSFVYWFYFFPLPGGRATLAVLSLGLICKLCSPTAWSRAKLGTTILHGASLILIIGGFVSSVSTQEGYLILAEGEKSKYFSDFRNSELLLVDTRPSDHNAILSFDEKLFQTGMTLKGLPFSIRIEEFFSNARIQKKEGPADPKDQNFARYLELVREKDNLEDEKNQKGVILWIENAGPQVDGRYLVSERLPLPQPLVTQLGNFYLELRRLRRELPFELKLNAFTQSLHPGTDLPRAYSSELELTEGTWKQNVFIEMNEPLHHNQYSVYQSGFSENNQKTVSVFAVVRNYGRYMPYICCFLMAIGLLIHLAQRMPFISRASRGANS